MTLKQAFEAACARFNGNNFEQLSESDRVLLTIWGLEAEVNNGGFDQYYFNGAGTHARHAPAALRRIGAQSMATIVERANALFGERGPPENDVDRQEAVFALTAVHEGPWDELDRQFYAYPDDILKLLERYLGITRIA